MRRRPVFTLAISVATFLILTAAPVADAKDKTPSLGAAVQVTDNPAPLRAHSSPQIAVNPKNGGLVVVESDVRGDRACRVHISTNGGSSWFPGGDPMQKPFTDCSFYAEYGAYATTAFAKDGTLYLAFVASEVLNRVRDDTPRHVFLARSSDGGRRFSTTRVFEAPDGNQDKGLNKGPMLAVDPTDSQRVYVGWRQGVFNPNVKEKLKSNVAASSDGGRTFGPPVDITDARGGDYPEIAVDSNGTVHAVYWVRVFPPTPSGQPGPVRPIIYRNSEDFGKTWSQPKEIDSGNQAASRPAALAADPRSDALYLVWHGNAEAMNQAPGFDGDLDIFLRASRDGGTTWSERVVVSDESTKANQYEPGIAIAPNGRVDVAWYDFRNSPGGLLTSTGHSGDKGFSDVYYASSTDDGRTFGRPVRVNDRSIDRARGVWSNNIDSKFNVGVASTNQAVFFAWQETRNAIRDTDAEDIYAATYRLSGDSAIIERTGIPPWTLAGAGLLGLGLGICIAWLFIRGRFAPGAPPPSVTSRVRAAGKV
jgi:hypothetical protein